MTWEVPRLGLSYNLWIVKKVVFLLAESTIDVKGLALTMKLFASTDQARRKERNTGQLATHRKILSAVLSLDLLPKSPVPKRKNTKNLPYARNRYQTNEFTTPP